MNPMRPTDLEPTAAELEVLLEDEELRVAEELEVPDDVKEEILQNIERRHEAAIEEEQAEGSAPSA
jgi:hypothetical protein